MTTIDLGKDLNATIVAAVNARIQAETFAALSSDEVLGKFVQAALMQPMQTERYGSKTTPYIEQVLKNAVQEATKAAVGQWVADNQGAIKASVEAALTSNMDGIAQAMVDSMVKSTDSGYSTKVSVAFEKRVFD
jgi:hypothetical protein